MSDRLYSVETGSSAQTVAKMLRVLFPDALTVLYQIGGCGKIETRSGPGVLVTPEARHQEVSLMRPQRTTPNVVCVQCGEAFHVNPFRLASARFCERRCHQDWQKTHDGAGRFQKGHVTWLTGMKGIHLSPATELKPGHRNNKEYEIGSVVRRCRAHRARNYIKTTNGWTYYAVWIWTQEYGQVFKGDVVHHLNGDRFDDRLDNLIALPRRDHPIYHGRWGCKPVPSAELDRYRARYVEAAS